MLPAEYFATIHSLRPETAAALDALARPLTLPRGAVLQRTGRIGRDIYLVQQGLLRTYYYHDGREVTNEFFLADEIAGEMQSIYTGRPSLYTLEVLEDCTLLAINYAALETLYTRHHDLEACGRLLAIDCFLGENARNRSFQMMTAKERYLQLRTARPEIFARAGLGHIASYLGVSQVQLSRIRRVLKEGAPTR